MADRQPLIYEPRVPELPSVPSPVIQAPPVPQLPTVRDPQIIGPYKPEKSSYLDYNDPYQINSLADIVMTTFNKDMKRRPVNVLGVNLADIPIVNMISSLDQYITDAYVTPISRGDWGAAGLNTLTNLSETLDILANPVKGLIMEGGEGALNGLGWGSEGRKNYDYDTGSFVGDMALELISDPLNWVTLFGKGAVSSMVKNTTKAGLESIGKETGEEIAEKAYKKLTKAIAKQFMEGTDKQMAQIAQEAAQLLMKQGKAPVKFTETFIKNLSNFALEGTTVDVLKGVSTFIRGAEVVDTAINRVGIGLPYVAWYGIKKAGKAIWEPAHTKFLKGLTPFLTPSGNLDIARLDEVVDYAKRFDGTAKEIYDMKEAFPTDEIYQIYLKEAVRREASNIEQFMKVNLKDIPNLNPSGKAKLVEEYLKDTLGMPPDEAVKLLQDMKNTDPAHKWIYDWVTNTLSPIQIEFLERRQRIWDIFHDVQATVQDLKKNKSVYNADTFEKYLTDKYGLTFEQLLEEAKGYNVILGSEFTWIKDFYQNAMDSLEKSAGYTTKNDVLKRVYEILKAPKQLEAESRLMLLEHFIMKEHKMTLGEYLGLLKKLNEKYDGVFTDYLKKLNDNISSLDMIDKVSAQYTIKEVAATAMEKIKGLGKNQKLMMEQLPHYMERRVKSFIEDVLQQNDVTKVGKKKIAITPEAYQVHVLKAKFNNETFDAYIEKIHTMYSNFTEKLLENMEKEYKTSLVNKTELVGRLHDIFENYWNNLKPVLREQAVAHPEGFYDLLPIFKDMPGDIKYIMEQGNPLLDKYNELIAKKGMLDNVVDYADEIKKNAEEFKENAEKLFSFRSDENLQHLADHIKILEKSRTVTDDKDFYEAFFKVFDGDTESPAKTFVERIYKYFGLEDPSKPFEDAVREWIQVNADKADFNIWEDTFANTFNELFDALAQKDFTDFIEQAESISITINAMSMQSKRAAETLQPLTDLFNEYNLSAYKPFAMNIDGEEVWYHFKLEQDYIMSNLMADGDFNEFVKELLSDGELGNMFKNLLLTGDQDAKLFLDTASAYMNYKEFLDNLYKYIESAGDTGLPIDHDIKGAFKSTLQKYAMRNPNELLHNLENNFYHIARQTEEQMNSMTMPKSLSLDKLIPKLETMTVTNNLPSTQPVQQVFAQGFLKDDRNMPKVLYRAAPLENAKMPGNGQFGKGVYLSDSYGEASQYMDAYPNSQMNYYFTDATNFYDLAKNGYPDDVFDETGRFLDKQKMTDILSAQGYDGVMIQYSKGNAPEYVIFDPKKLYEAPEDIPVDETQFKDMFKKLGYDVPSTAEVKALKYPQLQGLEEHHALDDTIRAWCVMDDELGDQLYKLYGDEVTDVKVIHIDTETTGFDGAVHSLTEIGAYSPELNIKHEFVFNQPYEGLKSAHVAKTVRTNNAASEKEIIKNFFNMLNQYEGQHIVVEAYNLKGFDRPFIMNRLTEYYQEAVRLGNTEDADIFKRALANMDRRSTSFKWVDGLQMLQEKYNYKVIPEETKLNLYYILRDFVYKQQDMAKLIQPIDTRLATYLKNVAQKLRDSSDILDQEKYLKYKDTYTRIYDFFKVYKNTNRDLGRIMLKKSIFDDAAFQEFMDATNITQALNTKHKQILDGVKQYGVKIHLDEKAIKEIFEVTGPLTDSQMLFRTNIARDVINEYNLIRNTSKLTNNRTITKTLIEFIDKVRMLDNIPEAFKSFIVPQDIKAQYALLRKLYTWTTEVFRNSTLHFEFAADGSKFEAYVNNMLEGVIGHTLDADLKALLEQPSLVRTRKFVDDGSISEAIDLELQGMYQARYDNFRQTYIDAAEAKRRADKILREAEKAEESYAEQLLKRSYIEVSTDEAISNMIDTVVRFEKKLEAEKIAGYRGYAKAAENIFNDYSDLMDMLENLGREWDMNGAARAVIQVRATSLKETYNMLDAVTKRHNAITNMWDQQKQILKYRRIADALAVHQIDTVLKLTDDDLFAHLVNNARGCIVIQGKVLTAEQLITLTDRAKNLLDKKINVIFEGDQIYIALDKSVTLSVFEDASGKIKHLANGVAIDSPDLPQLNVDGILDALLIDTEDAEIKRSISEVYKKLYNLVGDYDTGYSPHYGSIGEVTNQGYYKGMTNGKGEYIPGLYDALPDSVKNVLPHPDILYDEKFFHGASFNHSVLGTAAFRKQFHQYTNFDIVSMLTGSMTVQVAHTKSYMEYMNMFFDDTFSIANGQIAKFTDEELLEALKGSGEYRLVALVQDKKYGAKVIDLNPQNVSNIKKARELNAVIMAYQTYSKAFSAVNSFSMRHSKLNWLHKINYLYKAGFLLSPGTLMRNVIDSVMKNYIAASDDPTGMTHSFLTSWQMYWKYRNTAKEMIDVCTTKYGRVTEQGVREYFESGVSRLTKDEYNFIHGFMVDGPSGGEVKEWADYLKHDVNYGLYGSVIQATEFLMRPNTVVEQVCRLAEYMWAIEHGMPTTKAFALIAQTHFDYAIKTSSDRLIELLFPFYTFTMNNIHYWLDAFDRIPALMSVFRDIYTPIWNLDEYSPEELKYNRSLQYQILSGNLPLERIFGDNAENMTLKLNPSFMDVYQLATDPVNAILGKLSPIAQAVAGTAGMNLPEEMKFAYNINTPSILNAQSIGDVMQGILELLPIAGPMLNRYLVQGSKYRERTGSWLNSVLPDVFGATAPSKQYEYIKTPYQRKPYIAKPRRNYTKRPKKFYAKKFRSWANKYYPKKVYSSVGYAMDNFYNKLYSKTGKSRLKTMSIPVTSQTLKYRIKDMFYYYK
jgi:hypothetical protein